LPPHDLTPDAERLIAAHVDSVGTLDLLLLLHEGRDRDWSAGELCASLRCPDVWASEQLARLGAAGLVVEVSEGRHRYRRTRAHGRAVDAIARACRRNRAAVTRLIFTRTASETLAQRPASGPRPW
jgi:hypothetical protein